MALDVLNLEKDSRHLEVDCTYSIVDDQDGKRYLQIDTYGSKERQIPWQEEPIHTLCSESD